MGERDQVWEHGENLFPRFKCKYCVKEFCGGGATRLKEHLAGKSGNIARCTKYPPDIRNYFLCELQRAGQHCEHGGGSERGGGGGEVKRLFRGATSQRERPRDFDATRAKAPVQTRIDTSPWTSKRKSAKEVIERAWSKWFHVSGILGRNTDNPYFISSVKQTQQWGM
jgi:hypothetical protein